MIAALSRFGLGLAALAGWASSALGEDCAAIERRTQSLVVALSVAADELGAYRMLGDAALDGAAVCPASPTLWYWAARSAEVLDGPFAGRAFAAAGGAAKIVRDAEAHAPGSAPIATIAARAAGTEEAARRALNLDAAYPPARRALAMAMLKRGSPMEALKLAVSAGTSGPDRLTRARIHLALGHPQEAAAEAGAALTAAAADPAELTPTFEITRDANEIVGLALLAEGKPGKAKPFLDAAAAAGSSAAREALRRTHRP